MKNKTRRFLSWVLALALVLPNLGGLSTVVSAATSGGVYTPTDKVDYFGDWRTGTYKIINNHDGTLTFSGLPRIDTSKSATNNWSYIFTPAYQFSMQADFGKYTPLSSTKPAAPASFAATPSEVILSGSAGGTATIDLKKAAYNTFLFYEKYLPVWVVNNENYISGSNYYIYGLGYKVGDPYPAPAKVTYDVNGGNTYTTTRNSPQNYEYLIPGESLCSKIPTRGGYIFKGWYTAPTGGTQVTNGQQAWDAASPTSARDAIAVTLYAQWAPHTHTWKYGQTGTNQLYAYCTTSQDRCEFYSAGASVTGGPSLTINASPCNKVWNGSPCAAATVTTSNWSVTGASSTAQYVSREDGGASYPLSSTRPTKAGKYRAQITVGGVTAYSDFEITTPTAKVTANPTAKSVTYNRAPQALITAGTVQNGTMYYKVDDGAWSTSVPTATEVKYAPGSSAVASYLVSYYVKGATNYNGIGSEAAPMGTLQVPIVPKPLSVDMLNLDIEKETYTGRDMTQTVTVTDGGDTLNLGTEYTVSGDPLTQSAVGIYNVTLTGIGNYTGTTQKNWEIESREFASGEYTVTGVDQAYDGQEHSISVTGSLPGFKVQYAMSDAGPFEDANPVFKDVCNQKVYYRISATGHKTVTDYATVNITPAPAVVTPKADQGKLYNDPDGALEYEVSGLFGTDSLTGALEREPGEAVKSYAFNLGTLENPNYTLSLAADAPEYVISRKPLTGLTSSLDSSTNTYVFTGSPITPVVTLTDGVTTLTPGVDYTVTGGTETDTGKYTMTITGLGSYDAQFTLNWEIERAEIPVVITVTMPDFSYDGTVSTPTVSGTTPENAQPTFYYSQNPDGADGKPWDGVDADSLLPGTYYFYAVFPETDNYKAFTTTPVAFEVEAKTIDTFEITAEGVTVDYDAAPHSITVTTAGTLKDAEVRYGTTPGVYDLDQSPEFTSAQGSPYTVYFQVTATGCDPYEDSAVVTIDPIPAVITPKADQGKLYNDPDDTLEYEVSGLIGTDSLTGALGRAPGEEVKSYAFTLGTLDNPDYILSLAADAPEYVISRKPMTEVSVELDSTDSSYVFTGKPITPMVTLTDGKTTLIPGVDYTITGNEQTNYGSYTMTITGLGNYDLTLEVPFQILDPNDPTGEIAISSNRWNSFLNHITFGLLFKNTQTVTITAEDGVGESGVGHVYYHKSATALSLDEVKAITDWTEIANGGSFNIDPDNTLVIYAKIADVSGNTIYISSDGLVLDANAPTITGVTDGATYCEPMTITVTDRNLMDVTVDGASVKLVDDQYTLNPTNGEITVIASDILGNETTVKIAIYDEHDWNDPEFIWASDHSKATAKFVCKHDASHVQLVESDSPDTQLTTPATGARQGELTYTTTVSFNGETYTGQTVVKTDIAALEMEAGSGTSGSLETQVVVRPGVPMATVSGLHITAVKDWLTAAEQQKRADGANVKIWLEISSATGTDAEKAKIDALVAETVKKLIEGDPNLSAPSELSSTLGFLDLSVFKQVGDEITRIHDTGDDFLTVTVTVPPALQYEGATYHVIRIHDDTAEILTSGQNTALTFQTNKFSTYVLASVWPNGYVAASSVSVNIQNITLNDQNKTTQLKVTVSPANATDKTITWTSSDPSIAKVDANGNVTALKSGTVTITATTADGVSVSTKVTVNVKATAADASLTQTGQLKWPVPVLVCLCLMLLVIGLPLAAYQRRGRYEK